MGEVIGTRKDGDFYVFMCMYIFEDYLYFLANFRTRRYVEVFYPPVVYADKPGCLYLLSFIRSRALVAVVQVKIYCVSSYRYMLYPSSHCIMAGFVPLACFS